MKHQNYYIISVIITFLVLAKAIDWWQKGKTEEITLPQFKGYVEKQFVKEIAVFKKEKYVVVILNDSGTKYLKKLNEPQFYFNVISLKQMASYLDSHQSYSIYEYDSQSEASKILKKFQINL